MGQTSRLIREQRDLRRPTNEGKKRVLLRLEEAAAIGDALPMDHDATDCSCDPCRRYRGALEIADSMDPSAERDALLVFLTR